jgi:hypothetical protein
LSWGASVRTDIAGPGLAASNAGCRHDVPAQNAVAAATRSSDAAIAAGTRSEEKERQRCREY